MHWHNGQSVHHETGRSVFNPRVSYTKDSKNGTCLTLSIIMCGGARGVMVIVVGYGHGDTSSNPGPDWLNFR